MLQKLCLMASHTCPPGLVLQQELAMVHVTKGCQPLLPSAPRPEMIRYWSPCSRLLIQFEESSKSQKEWLNCKKSVNANLSARRPTLVDVQVTCPSTVLLGIGIVEQSTKHNTTLQFITSETAEREIGGVPRSLLSEPVDFQLSSTGEPQQPLTALIPKTKFCFSKPLLDIFQDSAVSSKITIHPDGKVTFMGTEIEIKNLISVVAESYLSEHACKGDKKSLLVPLFSRMNINEVEVGNHSSPLDIHSTLTAPLRSSEKVKVKTTQKKNKKGTGERDLYKKNYLHACESLLSLMVDKRQHRKTAILSLKKSGPELPELLTQFSAGIAGTGLAVLLSVICKLACGRVTFCASKLFGTGFGFGLVWLSWAVNMLRDTIVNMNRNSGKLGLKDEEMIHKVDRSLKEVYFRAAALLAMAVLRLT